MGSTFAMPNGVFEVYQQIARVFSAFFILLQASGILGFSQGRPAHPCTLKLSFLNCAAHNSSGFHLSNQRVSVRAGPVCGCDHNADCTAHSGVHGGHGVLVQGKRACCLLLMIFKPTALSFPSALTRRPELPAVLGAPFELFPQHLFHHVDAGAVLDIRWHFCVTAASGERGPDDQCGRLCLLHVLYLERTEQVRLW